jgi:hypothetical protein
MPTPEWKLWNIKGKYMLLAKFQAFEMSNARYEATNRVDQLEMKEVTFERHQRLPSRWHYAINNSTLKNPESNALSKKNIFRKIITLKSYNVIITILYT